MSDDKMRNKCSAKQEDWEEDDSDEDQYDDLLLAKTKVAAAKAEAKAERCRSSGASLHPAQNAIDLCDEDEAAGSNLTAGQQRQLESDGFV